MKPTKPKNLEQPPKPPQISRGNKMLCRIGLLLMCIVYIPLVLLLPGRLEAYISEKLIMFVQLVAWIYVVTQINFEIFLFL